MARNFEKALTGFNHNINYKGKVYHVQTEDSGVSNAHIITHLFMGGNIVASKRTSYADIVSAEHLPEIVRELMEEQHKEMLRNLMSGAFDQIGVVPKHYEPGQLAASAPAASPSSHVAKAPASPVVHVQRSKPSPAQTLFGEDLISEKSLDEVILRYLAGEGDQ